MAANRIRPQKIMLTVQLCDLHIFCGNRLETLWITIYLSKSENWARNSHTRAKIWNRRTVYPPTYASFMLLSNLLSVCSPTCSRLIIIILKKSLWHYRLTSSSRTLGILLLRRSNESLTSTRFVSAHKTSAVVNAQYPGYYTTLYFVVKTSELIDTQTALQHSAIAVGIWGWRTLTPMDI